MDLHFNECDSIVLINNENLTMSHKIVLFILWCDCKCDERMILWIDCIFFDAFFLRFCWLLFNLFRMNIMNFERKLCAQLPFGLEKCSVFLIHWFDKAYSWILHSVDSHFEIRAWPFKMIASMFIRRMLLQFLLNYFKTPSNFSCSKIKLIKIKAKANNELCIFVWDAPN